MNLKKHRILRIQRRLKFLNVIRLGRCVLWRYFARQSSEPFVFVVGAPRSGTSLLFNIIRSHPQFTGIDDETYFFVLRDVFNKSYTKFCETNGLSVQQYKECLNQSRDQVDLFERLALTMLRRDGKTRFIEKTPFHVLHLGYILKHFPNAKIVHAIRDGRDCYLSHLRLEEYYHRDVARFSRLWKKMITIRRKLGDNPNIIDIKYEVFVEQPEAEIKRVMSFLGEDYRPHQIDPRSYSQTSLKDIKGHNRLERSISNISVGKWKDKMKKEDITLFNKIASKTLTDFGYNLA